MKLYCCNKCFRMKNAEILRKEKKKEVFIELGKKNFLEERKKYKDIKNIHV